MLNSNPSSLVFHVTRHSSLLPTCCQGSSVVLFFPRNNWQSETSLYNYKTIQLSNCRTFPSIRSAKKTKKVTLIPQVPGPFRETSLWFSRVLPAPSQITRHAFLVSCFFFYRPSSLIPFQAIFRFFASPKKVHKNPLHRQYTISCYAALVIRSSIRF